MLRLPGRKKRGKGEKKVETPTRSDRLKVTPAEGGMSSSTVPSVCVEDVTKSRPRTYSSVSNTSADSYHTALSGASPNSSDHVPPRFALPGRDDILKEVLEKLTQIESSQKNLATRVGYLEVMMKQLQPRTTERDGTNTSIMGSTIHIPDPIEVIVFMTC